MGRFFSPFQYIYQDNSYINPHCLHPTKDKINQSRPTVKHKTHTKLSLISLDLYNTCRIINRVNTFWQYSLYIDWCHLYIFIPYNDLPQIQCYFSFVWAWTQQIPQSIHNCPQTSVVNLVLTFVSKCDVRQKYFSIHVFSTKMLLVHSNTFAMVNKF